MTPFESIAREFIASRLSAGTRGVYTRDLHRWLDRCDASGTNPAKATIADASAYRDELREKCEPLTVRRIMACLSAVYARAAATGAAARNPFSPVAIDWPPSSEYQQTEAVSDSNAGKIIAEVDQDDSVSGKRDAALLHLLRSTGLRRSSIVSLRRDSLIDRGGVRRLDHVFVKGDKKVQCEVDERTAEAIQKWAEVAPPSRWLFPPLRGDPRKHVSEAVINIVLKARAKAAGASKGIHPHQFRAAFITAALDAGVSLRDVQAAVHQADPKTTLRYDRGKRGQGVVGRVEKFRDGK